MLKVYFALGLALVIIGLYAVEQNKDESSYRVWSVVDSVSAALSDADAGNERAWDLWVKGSHGDACALDLRSDIAHFPQNIDIQLYREMPSTANCAGDEAFFERRLPLADEILAGQPPYLIINNQAWAIVYPEGEQIGAPIFETRQLIAAQVERAALLASKEGEEAVELRIQGQQAIGCELPELYAMRASAASVSANVPASVTMSVYNAIGADMLCPDLLVLFDAKLSLPATNAPPDALFMLNAMPHAIPIEELEMPEMKPIDKVLTNILAVRVNITKSESTRISLDAQGEHPDGCDLPVIVSQTRQGNIVTVEVYREVPIDLFCPMILQPYQDRIQLDGDFAPGEYIINVNTFTQSLEVEA